MTEENSNWSRRTFLKAVSGTAVVAGCSKGSVPHKLYPYLIPQEEIALGTPAYYRTVCRECSAGCGVTAKTREGRVIKLEGNPEDPIGRGALCARGQASVQRLYSPSRLHGPMERTATGKFAPVSWEAALKRVGETLASMRQKHEGAKLRILTRPEPGSAGAVQRSLLAAVGSASSQRIVFDPLDPASLRDSGRLLFGRNELPAFDLSQARTVVSFGADFLETWLSPVELTRSFSEGRGKTGPERTRLTWVGPRLSATGGSADLWLKARAGSEAVVALGLLRWIVDPVNAVTNLAPEAPELFARLHAFDGSFVEEHSSVTESELEQLGRELATRRPSALLGPGVSSTGRDAATLANAVQLTNYVLGNLNTTVSYGLDPALDPPSAQSAFQALIADMNAGKVSVLVLHHAAVAETLPTQLGFLEALAKVALVVSFADELDASSHGAHLVLPDCHPLESFGDVSVRKGIVALTQPAMRPLEDTRMASEVLLQLGKSLGAAELTPFADFYEYSQSHVAKFAQGPTGGDDTQRGLVQRSALERGGYYAKAVHQPVRLNLGGLPPFQVGGSERKDSLALVPFPTVRYQSTGTASPWLQETPDVTSSVTWRPWVELSILRAKALGVQTGDVVELKTESGVAELPVYIYPKLRDEAVAVPFGAPALLALMPARFDGASGAMLWASAEVALRKTGRREVLARISVTPEPHSGELVKTVSSSQGFALPVLTGREFYPAPEHPVHRWAMAIDLDRCTGCQACVVACYAENNVPVMGPEFVAEGRSMAWLRVQRYFPEEDAGLEFMPMLCQQCGNAPCEPVCPTYATYHTKEGLNAQVYNRCVGTRYCSNNCPYKVRTFNYKDPVFESPLNLQLNPDVTVRSKGVMEKCTFCVQRIRVGENEAKNGNRAVRDGEVVPACAQTCPGHAIVFGDANDVTSRVHALARDPRGYGALSELNTQPAITYLARVREPK